MDCSWSGSADYGMGEWNGLGYVVLLGSGIHFSVPASAQTVSIAGEPYSYLFGFCLRSFSFELALDEIAQLGHLRLFMLLFLELWYLFFSWRGHNWSRVIYS